eukprot:scaffold84760_cov78-Phaeocystis_antarctica.AAC.3
MQDVHVSHCVTTPRLHLAGATRRGRTSPPRPSLMPAASVDARRALAFSHHTYALLPHATALDDVKSALFSRGPCTRALSGVEISIISESHLARPTPSTPARPAQCLARRLQLMEPW